MRKELAAAIVVSASGLAMVAGHEAYRQVAYRDSAGVWTVGYGTTRLDGRAVKPGDRLTPERALIVLHEDLAKHWRDAGRCIAEVPLYQHEADAYASLAYNIGVGAFCGSTLVRKLRGTLEPKLSETQRAALYREACQEIKRWNKVMGVELKGLTRRRAEEAHLCLTGQRPSRSAPTGGGA